LSGNQTIINLANKTLSIKTKNEININNYENSSTTNIDNNKTKTGINDKDKNNESKINTRNNNNNNNVKNDNIEINIRTNNNNENREIEVNTETSDNKNNNTDNTDVSEIKNEAKIEKREELYFALKPRTETIISIPVANPRMENKIILIEKQELTEDVFCGNTATTVRNGCAIISVLNNSENPKIRNREILSKLLYEDDLEYRIYKAESANNQDRISKIGELIRSDHIKQESRKCVSVFKNNIKRYHENPI
jgi:hypothetical protein